jgi:hypothetical protein
MRAMMALVLHLGGVGEYMSQILGWTVCFWESGDLHLGIIVEPAASPSHQQWRMARSKKVR